MRFLTVAVVMAALVAAYFAWGHILRRVVADYRAAASEGTTCLARLLTALRGWRTLIVARLIWVPGAIVAAHDGIASLFAGTDVTPISTALLGHVPEDWRPLVMIVVPVVMGAAFDWLRRRTTGPVGEPSPAADADAEA